MAPLVMIILFLMNIGLSQQDLMSFVIRYSITLSTGLNFESVYNLGKKYCYSKQLTKVNCDQ